MTMPNTYEAADRADTFVPHAFPEQSVDLGEVRMNYVQLGDTDRPPLLLIPGQTESWWGYEAALPLLSERFRCYAVDLRGQGRSSWTPGRYSVDNVGNDLVRFIDTVIGEPTLISGLSSGGVMAAWLSAYAKPGQITAAVWEIHHCSRQRWFRPTAIPSARRSWAHCGLSMRRGSVTNGRLATGTALCGQPCVSFRIGCSLTDSVGFPTVCRWIFRRTSGNTIPNGPERSIREPSSPTARTPQ